VGRRLAWTGVAGVALAACAPGVQLAPVPEAPDAWIAFDVPVPDRDSRNLLRSFEACARAFGCHTERHRGWGGTGTPGRGRTGIYSSVIAQCEEGVVGVVATGVERVRVACAKPATRGQCETLVTQIGGTPPARW
jgi:hypothetical protein